MRTPGSLDGNDFCFRDRARPATSAAGAPPRPVVDPEGRRWPSISAAARAYRISRMAISYRIENTTTGWRYAGNGR